MKKILLTLGIGATIIVGDVILGASQNPYSDKGTHYEMIVDEDKVRIAKDKPEFTLERWGGEETITIKRAGSFNNSKKDLLKSSRTIERVDGKESVIVEPLEDGVKIDIILNERPTTNVFTFEIEGYEDFDFWYQSPLTQEEIDAGDVQPDNVTGSYAVYHKTKKNNKYMTGKAYHIYRPKIIDADGNEVWGEMDFDNGTLSVIVPQQFLDEAVYPVRVDPEFGKTTCGASNSTRAADTVSANFKGDTAPASATVDSFHTCHDGNGVGTVNAKGVLYNYVDDASTIVSNGVTPSALLPATSGGVYLQIDYVSKPSIVLGQPYSLGLIPDATHRYYYDSTGSGGWFDDTNSYATPQDTGALSDTARMMSHYITYTEGGAAPATVAEDEFFIVE